MKWGKKPRRIFGSPTKSLSESKVRRRRRCRRVPKTSPTRELYLLRELHLPFELPKQKRYFRRRQHSSAATGFLPPPADCEEAVTKAWIKVGCGNSGLSGVRDQIQAYGAELHAWGSSKTKPETEEIERTTSGIEIESLLCSTRMMLKLFSKFPCTGGWCRMSWLCPIQRMVGSHGFSVQREKFTKYDNEKCMKELEVMEGGYLDLGLTLFRVCFKS
ncbi:hypothetical protein CFP56_006524 [Quercus suber]|uniref:Uncharacterized protein n=1 Tax=Quercus suber TaxID=58331 RepID=A0AAW0L804_QUESU